MRSLRAAAIFLILNRVLHVSSAVFVDRDGVIIEDGEYVYRVEDLKLISGAVDGLRDLSAAGFQIILQFLCSVDNFRQFLIIP